MRIINLFVLLIISSIAFGQNTAVEVLDTTGAASYRGLSVIDNNVIWVSGTKGTVGKSRDGGNTWQYLVVKGHENADFRSIWAFDSLNVLIANAGSPAFILRTADGGQNWTEVYKNEDPKAFIDGISFWDNKHGAAIGDPINDQMLVLSTVNKGISWERQGNAPLLEQGEAEFAASGTTIRCIDNKKLIVATGGSKSRIWISNDRGNIWVPYTTPIMQGQSSQGIFSLASNENTLFIAGGDYKAEEVNTDVIFYSTDFGKTWIKPNSGTRGYRESIEKIGETTWLALGPKGMDISYNQGKDWQALNDLTGYHAIRKARNGNLVILVGSKGKIATLVGKY